AVLHGALAPPAGPRTAAALDEVGEHALGDADTAPDAHRRQEPRADERIDRCPRDSQLRRHLIRRQHARRRSPPLRAAQYARSPRGVNGLYDKKHSGSVVASATVAYSVNGGRFWMVCTSSAGAMCAR